MYGPSLRVGSVAVTATDHTWDLNECLLIDHVTANNTVVLITFDSCVSANHLGQVTLFGMLLVP